MTFTRSVPFAMLASSLLGCLSIQAGTETLAAPTSSSTATGLLVGKLVGETNFDRTWSAFTLYKDDTRPILQEFSLQGLLQAQYADGNSDNGHFDIRDFKDANAANNQSVWGDHFEARRARIGFKSRWYQNWKFGSQIDADTTDGANKIYRDIYELYLTYAPTDAMNVTVGKTELKFGRQQEILSKEILTLERSLVSNLLAPGELTGVMVNGKGIQDYWTYELGLYGTARARALTGYDAGTVTLGKIGYDYASQSGLDTALASVHFVHNSAPGFKETDSDNFYSNASPAFTDSIALNNDITMGRFGLITDILYGFGYQGTADQAGVEKSLNQTDVLGVSVIPSYFIAKGLQLVGQLQWATSERAQPASGNTPATTNLALYSRYEKWAPSVIQNGDNYASAYIGLNYYLYSHKLKFMNGIQYSTMDGGLAKADQTTSYHGYTFLSGLRFYF
ncbi:MAG: porin [Akkermansiaceae bacterium]|nr:porin [Akkermansiaceae bacterium]